MSVDRVKMPSVDEIQKYIASGITIMPGVRDTYLSQLVNLCKSHRVCLLPITVLNMYNIELNKRLAYKAQQCKRRELAKQHRKVG